MKSVVVRGVKIGEGIPKICAPITGKNKEEILHEAESLQNFPVDLAEWRADWFENVFDDRQVMEVLTELRGILKEKPLLFTFRSQREGGAQCIEPDNYVRLNRAVCQTGCVDLIDAELSFKNAAASVIEQAHCFGVKAVASSHDFEKTPDKDEIIKRLCQMQQLGADILKIAVMPQNQADVLTLLAATEAMYRKYADRPIITMSMAGIGCISRLCGEIFGSAVTFGAAAQASAPGQFEAKQLSEALLLIHNNIKK